MSDLRDPCPSPFNMAAYVLAAGVAQPDKIALSLLGPDGSVHWSYEKLIAAVRGTAGGLLEQGLTPGDVVLLRLGNTPDFPIAYLGALAAGLVPVPTSSALTQSEVVTVIDILRPAIILHDPEVACPPVPMVLTLADLRSMYTLPPAPFHMGDPERLGYIIFTSGTSGTPSAVMHAHRAIWARRMMFDGWYGLRAKDRLLHAGAFNWTYTLGTGLMDPWTIGATALIPAPGTPAADLPALMASERASIFAAAPGVYRQMLRAAPLPAMPALRHGLSAGEKMAAPLRKAWEETTQTAVYEAFGMSECSTFISGSPATPARPGSIGTPQPGRKVTLRNDGQPAALGTPGTIAIHRSDPGLMLGYLNAQTQTADRFDGDWFLTGDQAVMDGDGHITYLGRADDMMNAGGFRVSPLEVEAHLLTLPDITGVGVCAVEIKPGTDVIAAFYTAVSPLREDVLNAHARQTLARYKQPRIYVHVDALPTSGNGKLSRRALRAQFKASRQ